jgi:C4-dicarboxylate-specific signal transduction histidine kinase
MERLRGASVTDYDPHPANLRIAANHGNKGQLQEVIINLVYNAIEAMDAVKTDRRVLQVRTERGVDAITVAVEDSGPGIDQKN